jgi:glycosyltransferase involved in cell wall biosynthesis
MPQNTPEISIVVPLFNEEGNVEKLHSLICETMQSTERSYEIVYINDGSTDRTLEKLQSLPDPQHLTWIFSLKGNRGQTAALAAGFDHARGSIVISMDGDLQHDPREIPAFLKEIDSGHDLVSGWREHRIDPLFTRKIPSKVANWIMSKWSGVPLHDFGTTYKAYRSEVLNSVTLYGEFHRFIPVLVEGMELNITEIPIRSLPRQEGRSNYSLNRTFTVFFDLIRIRFLTRYLTRPLQVFGSLGFILGLMGFCIACYLSYIKFFHGISIMEYRAPMFLLSILLMLVGSQFLTMGLLGEILVKIYYKQPDSRIYFVDNVFRPGDSQPEDSPFAV